MVMPIAPIIPKKKRRLAYVYDYDKGTFVESTEEEVARREAFYQRNPQVGPPGTPGKITPQQLQQNTLRKVYPEVADLPDAMTGIKQRAADTPDDFLADLMKRNVADVDLRNVLAMVGASDEEADELVREINTSRIDQKRENEIFGAVFPDLDKNLVIESAMEDFPQFIKAIQQKGRTPETDDLLRLMGYTDQEREQIFAPAETAAPIGVSDTIFDKQRVEQPETEQFPTGKTPTVEEWNAKYFQDMGWDFDFKKVTLAKPSEQGAMQAEYENRMKEASAAYRAKYGTGAFVQSAAARAVEQVASPYWAKKYIQPTKEEPSALEKGFAAIDVLALTPFGIILKPAKTLFKAGKFIDKAWDAIPMVEKKAIGEAWGLDEKVLAKAGKELTPDEVKFLQEGLAKTEAQAAKEAGMAQKAVPETPVAGAGKEVKPPPSAAVAGQGTEAAGVKGAVPEVKPDEPPKAAVPPAKPPEKPPTATGGAMPEPDSFKPNSIEQGKALARIPGKPALTTSQADRTLSAFGKYVDSPTTENAWQLTGELRREERALRAEALKARAQELIVSKGVKSEDAMNQAIRETMAGELPSVRTDYLDDLTDEMRNVLFSKVYNTLRDEPFEMMSTIQALTNALEGKPIPRELGVKGGSALTRLQRVFSDQPQVLKAIEKAAEEKKPLRDVVEGIFHETGREPVPIDQDMVNYLRSLSTKAPEQEIPGLFRQTKTGELALNPKVAATKTTEVPYQEMKVADPRNPLELSYARAKLDLDMKLAMGKIDKETHALELAIAKEKAYPVPPVPPPREPPIADAFKELPLWPQPAKNVIYRALKEAGMTIVDIGGFIKAMKSSVDMSYWRQVMPLIPNHKKRFAMSNVEAWKALFSQKSAEASWARIIRDPDEPMLYTLYDQLQKKQGRDFLRPFEMPKGTAQWKGVEEFGYLNNERIIPRLTAKIPTIKVSNRAFVTGTNSVTWGAFKDFYKSQLRVAEKFASGKLKLPEGKAFDIVENMDAYATMLADWSGRASLGKLAPAAPILGNLFYAPRYALGRVIGPRQLFSPNPYVRKEAWKDAAMFVGTIGGTVMAGRQLGFWDVETNRNSADFMKIREGNMHIDPWGGAQQFVVFFSRLFDLATAPITGKEAKGKSTITGAEYPLDAASLVENFLQAKQAPLIGLINEYITGKTFGGEKVDITNPKQWAERIAPMVVTDIIDAMQDDEANPLIAGPLAFTGFGIQTYTGDWKENEKKLGLLKYPENLEFGATQPVYDVKDLWSDTAPQFKGVDPATLTEKKGYGEKVKAIAEAKSILDEIAQIPNVKLNTLVKPHPETKETFVEYYNQWQESLKITDEKELAEFDKKYPRAHLGNFSQREYALLQQYAAISPDDETERKAFLEANPEINVDPRDEHLKANPDENAKLALWGQAKIYSAAAYDKAMTLARQLDIPDNALPDWGLPEDEETRKAYFKYQETVEKFKSDSPEAHLLLKQNDKLRQFLNRSEIKVPVAALEMDIKNRKLNDAYEELTSDEQRQSYLKSNPQYADDRERIEAYKKQYKFDNTEADRKTVDSYVEYGKAGAGNERTLYRIDHPDFDALWSKVEGWQPLNVKSVDALRLKVKNQEKEKELDALPTPQAKDAYILNPKNRQFALDKYRAEGLDAGIPKAKIEAYAERQMKDKLYSTLNPAQKKEFMAEDPTYHQEVINETGAKLGIPEHYMPKFSQYEMTTTEGQARERFLQANPDYYVNIHLGIQGKSPVDFSKVASEKFERAHETDYKTAPDKELYRYLNPDFDAEGVKLGKWKPVFVKSVLARQLTIANQALDDQYDRLVSPVAKQEFMSLHPDYARSKVMIKGLNEGVPEEFIDAYVTFKSIPSSGYAMERFMVANLNFYRDVYKGILGEKPLDFRAIPSVSVEAQYNTYRDLRGAKKTAYLRSHSALRKWMEKRAKLRPSLSTDYQK